MSFHLHILNLEEGITSRDIRKLFLNLTIQQDGVTIIGGSKGEAFITFGSELDLLQAMKQNEKSHLKFRIATDGDKLKALKRMCIENMEKMEKANSVFIQDISKNTNQEEIITVEMLDQSDSPHVKHSVSSDISYSNNDSDTKRRKLDGMKMESHDYSTTNQNYIKSQPDKGVKQEKQSFCWPQNSSGQIQHRPSFPYNAMQFPPPLPPMSFPPMSMPPMAIPPMTVPSMAIPPMTVPSMSVPPMANPLIPVPPMSIPQMPLQPIANPPMLVAQMPGPTCPVSPHIFTSLLPGKDLNRFCIQTSDVPPDVTPSLIWSWVGGPLGAAIGVTVLKPTNSPPTAFLIYDKEYERDQRLKCSAICVVKRSAYETCEIINNFIKQWTDWKGNRKMHSPIFETTTDGKDRYVDHKSFYKFAQAFSQYKETKLIEEAKTLKTFNHAAQHVPQIPNIKAEMKKVLLLNTNIEDLKAHKMSLVYRIRKDPLKQVYLVIYELQSSIAATEVLSWFRDGISVIKVDVDNESESKGENVAFVLFANEDMYADAVVDLRGTNVVTAKWTVARVYETIGSFSSKYRVTTSTAGQDRIISLDERHRPPYVVRKIQLPVPEPLHVSQAQKGLCQTGPIQRDPTLRGPTKVGPIEKRPAQRAFSVLDTKLKNPSFLHLKEMACNNATTKHLWKQFPNATLIIVFKRPYTGNYISTDAFLEFRYVSFPKKVGYKNLEHKRLNRDGAFYILSMQGFDIRISKSSNLPDFRVSFQDAKYLASKMRVTEVPKVISMNANPAPEKEASFLHHLKTVNANLDNQKPFLILHKMKYDLTACQLCVLVPGAACALRAYSNEGTIGETSSKVIGILYFKDIAMRNAGRLLVHNQFKWRIGNAPDASFKVSEITTVNKRLDVSALLSRICDHASIFESTPSAVDRHVAHYEVSWSFTKYGFKLVPQEPSLHYVLLTEFDKDRSVCGIYSWFAGSWNGVKGAVLLSSITDQNDYLALLAFDSLENCQKAFANKDTRFTFCWPSAIIKTELEVFAYLTSNSENYIIKVSTDIGPERDLTNVEKELLCPQNKMVAQEKPIQTLKHIDKATNELSDDLGQTTTSIEKSDTLLSTDTQIGNTVDQPVAAKRPAYMRIRKVPATVTNASEMLAEYVEEGCNHNAISATLVCDCAGVPVTAYVMFNDVEDRNMALSKGNFSMRCTAHARAIRLKEIELGYQIFESTSSGKDRLMSSEERHNTET